MNKDNDILDFLNGIAPTTTNDVTEPTVGSGDTFNNAQAGVPQMGPPLINMTIPKDGEEVTHGHGKLVYYGQGGRKFFGYYTEMNVVRQGNTITLTGTLKED